jgi:hypothetical protein
MSMPIYIAKDPQPTPVLEFLIQIRPKIRIRIGATGLKHQ